jgi:hypothetical protein
MARVTRLVGGGFAALLIAPWLGGVVANASSSTPPLSGDIRATAVAGNATTCSDVGFPDDTAFGAGNSSGNSGSGFTVTSDGQNLTVSAIPANTTIDVLIVKGGDAYNEYPSGTFTTLPTVGLHAPLVGQDKNVPTISHWFLCSGPSQPQPLVTPPTATSTGDCDSADIVLNAGSNATDFTVTRAGDLAGQIVPVGAGQTQHYPVSVDSTHSSATVTANGQTLDTFIRDNAVCDANNGGGGNNNGGGGNNGGVSSGATVTNPAVSASKACKSGITVTLSNVGATAPVTFTLTAPDGTISTVTVGANQSASRSFGVDEDTTASVRVAAPGLDTRTVSYHKDCVTVLGVKHVRHHRHHRHHRRSSSQGERTHVLGSSAAQLPFTGFNARRTAVDAGLTIGLGLALCLIAGRRREPAPSHRRH